MTRDERDVAMEGTEIVEFLAETDILVGMGESLFATVGLIIVEAAKGIVGGELEVALMDLMECLGGKLVEGDDVGGVEDGALDIIGQFFARADFDVGVGVVEMKAFDFLDVVPLFVTVDELLGVLAGDTIGVFFALAEDDVGVVAHTPFETFDDLGVGGVEEGVGAGDDVFFDVHCLVFLQRYALFGKRDGECSDMDNEWSERGNGLVKRGEDGGVEKVGGVGAGEALRDGCLEAVEEMDPVGRHGGVGGEEVHGLGGEEALALGGEEAFVDKFGAVDAAVVVMEIEVVGLAEELVEGAEEPGGVELDVEGAEGEDGAGVGEEIVGGKRVDGSAGDAEGWGGVPEVDDGVGVLDDADVGEGAGGLGDGAAHASGVGNEMEGACGGMAEVGEGRGFGGGRMGGGASEDCENE